MPVGSAFHERTHALCESLNYRDWSGYYAVSAYETHHEHEYNAIRNACAVIDISPLYKYRVSGRDAARLINRIITRDASKLAIGQVYYTPWCDEEGKVIDDGTVTRVAEQMYRWTAADPSLRWITENAAGLDVTRRGHQRAGGRAWRCRGRRRRGCCDACRPRRSTRLKYFRATCRNDRRRAGRHHPHRLHGRPRLRNLDAVGRGAHRLGRDR